MLVALVCVISALALFIGAPFVLTLGRWQIHLPRLAMFAWFSAFTAGCVLVLAALVATILAAQVESSGLGAAEASVLTVGAWLSLGAIGAVLAFISASSEPLAQSYHEAVRSIAAVAVSRQLYEDFTLVRVDTVEPFAVALPGKQPEIFISTGLEQLLTSAQLVAVLAHEHAHLRLHHGRAVRIAEVNALCLPRFLQAGAGLKRATMLLIELIADDAAARQAGAANLANALARMADASGDATLTLRAERLALRRWPTADRRQVPIAMNIIA
jgi:Zn-dependent protease with chaperone function